jgi:hypothetical protein
MVKVAIFGASNLGKACFYSINSQVEILYFCDNNPILWQAKLFNIPIISTSMLKEKVVEIDKIVVASMYYKEIVRQLEDMDIDIIIEKFYVGTDRYIGDTDNRMANIKEINLGEFLSKIKEIKLSNITYMYGAESGILDYAFLRALIVKFNLKTYLEIGTFLGTSIDAVADVTKKCYGVTLPRETLNYYFDTKNMKNFSRYFSDKIINANIFECDSKIFDYTQIEEQIDIYFIDGDHTYEGVYTDTKRVFERVDTDNTFVVWHDFKNYKHSKEILQAIADAIPVHLMSRIYGVDNNMCGIYIPDKYLHEFTFSKNADEIYSYTTTINSQLNRI